MHAGDNVMKKSTSQCERYTSATCSKGEQQQENIIDTTIVELVCGDPVSIYAIYRPYEECQRKLFQFSVILCVMWIWNIHETRKNHLSFIYKR